MELGDRSPPPPWTVGGIFGHFGNGRIFKCPSLLLMSLGPSRLDFTLGLFVGISMNQLEHFQWGLPNRKADPRIEKHRLALFRPASRNSPLRLSIFPSFVDFGAFFSAFRVSRFQRGSMVVLCRLVWSEIHGFHRLTLG